MQSENLRIEEIGTDRYVSAEAAQEAGLSLLAEVLLRSIKSDLDLGRYIVENGFVMLPEEVSHEQ